MELAEYLRELRYNRPSFWEQWYAFWKVYRLHERIDNLQGLIDWASQKRLKQRHYYQRLMTEAQARLLDHRLLDLRLSRWAYRWYWLVRFLFPARRYHAEGSAQIYRRSYAYEKPKTSALSKLVKALKQA